MDELDLLLLSSADSHDVADHSNIISWSWCLSSDCGLTWSGVCSRADFLRSSLQHPDQLTPPKDRAVAIPQKWTFYVLWIQERIHANGSAQGEISNQIGLHCVWVMLPVLFRLPKKNLRASSRLGIYDSVYLCKTWLTVLPRAGSASLKERAFKPGRQNWLAFPVRKTYTAFRGTRRLRIE